jgi:hypothetical protein
MAGPGEQACKVDRVSETWGLENIDERLRRRREGSDASLRDLEEFFNREVLEAALRDARAEVVQGEVENTYRLLTADDVSSGAEVEVRDRLERSGVDPEAVTADFVSYQTIRSHLRNCLDIETERSTELTPTDGKNTVFKLLSRTEVITKRTIDRLRSAGHVAVGDVDVTMSLRVTCTECGEEYAFSRLVDRGGCGCSGPDSE